MNTRQQLRTLAELAFCNPFSRKRIEFEQRVLGDAFVPDAPIAWSYNAQTNPAGRANIPRLQQLAEQLIQTYQPQLSEKAPLDLLQDYVDVTIYMMLYRHLVQANPDYLFQTRSIKSIWQPYLEAYHRHLSHPALRSVSLPAPDHLFACLTQIRRAFHNIYLHILGESLPAAQLRATVWESIFTNDLRRYYERLYLRLSQLPTLITGPSGTGKELIARAIALSQYIPFDADKQRFTSDDQQSFFPLNLSAMSETLIESELFGHRRGAFTGAMTDREGWLQQCRPHGAIFLDEIGELAPNLQVKLLRVVQQRTYSRLGETIEQRFEGKIIGATNRDMGEQIQQGNFREDLYFRLCADRIHTPSLRQQLNHYPEDLASLVHAIADRLIGESCEDFSRQATNWILQNLGDDYPWRGNMRELEQCISSILIRGYYLPADQFPDSESITGAVIAPAKIARGATKGNATEPWLTQLQQGNLTADQLLQHYCNWSYQQTGSYEATARQLGLDRRTVKAKIEKLG